MKTQLALAITILTLLLFPNIHSGQTGPDLKTAGDFVLFSSVGAVGNTGISQLTGNIGTNSGAITSFGNVNGVMHNTDAATLQAAADLLNASQYLDTLSPTFIHGPVLGNGDTLYAGVDTIFAAASIVGILNLDAQGDPNAVFIFKIGGALTSAASATVNLINGAAACNIFWITKGGAISLATLTTMRGTLIANPGAIALGAGCTLEGRALSITGAVTVYGTLAYIPVGCLRAVLTGPIAPGLGPLECFALFSSNGNVSNAGITTITGDIGTNNGSTTGFIPALVTGTVHPIPDTATVLAAAALPNVYTYLTTLPYDIELLYPAQFGNDLVLTPHTYRMNAAAAFTGILYLNAEDNPDAIFVIQVNGALSTSTFSEVRLINGTQAKNVYWKVEGAVTINDNSIFCGTIVANSGAISLTTGVILNGRGLTTVGAITTTAVTINKPSGCSFLVLPVELLSYTGGCDKNNHVVIKWSTAGEINSNYYSIERGIDGIDWQTIGMIEAKDDLSERRNYSFTDKAIYSISYYRLKQTDLNGTSKYFKSIVIKNCREDLTELIIYPNPSMGTFNLSFNGEKDKFHSVSIYNVAGEKVYHSEIYPSAINLPGKPNGVYFIQVNTTSTTIIKKLVIKR